MTLKQQEIFEMANYRHDPTTTQKGKIVYDKSIVDGIVSLAITEVDGVTLNESNKKAIKLDFEKDGLYADISVIVKYGYSVPTVSFKIQQTIKQNVETMTSFKVCKVNVNVESVDFSDEVIQQQ